jgi:hypothetical protein
VYDLSFPFLLCRSLNIWFDPLLVTADNSHMLTCRLTRLLGAKFARVVGASPIISAESYDEVCEFHLCETGAVYSRKQSSSSAPQPYDATSTTPLFLSSGDSNGSGNSVSPNSPTSPSSIDDSNGAEQRKSSVPCHLASRVFGAPHKGIFFI